MTSNENQQITPNEIPSSDSGFNFTSKTSLLWLKREVLQQMCIQNGLNSSGTKDQLADRLVRFYTELECSTFPSLEDFEDDEGEKEEDEESHDLAESASREMDNFNTYL